MGKKAKASMAPSSQTASPSSSVSYVAFAVAVAATGVAFWISSGNSNVVSTKSGSVPAARTNHAHRNALRRWPENFVAPLVAESDIPHDEIRHLNIFENGGNSPLGTFNATAANFHTLGIVYNSRGQVVPSLSSLGRDEANLWRGPEKPGQHFMWPGVSVGHRITVPEMNSPSGLPVELETLSMGNKGTPRVFYVHNFLSDKEAQELIDYSTNEANPYKMAPSTAGTEKAWNQGGSETRVTTRTSMNAFDITTSNAASIKRRSIELLRIPEYLESMLDGIQILRYELGQAYVAHEDYFQTYQSKDHNWDPTKGGSNRFATIFLYLSDVEEGGQTVFPKLPIAQMNELTDSTRANMQEALGETPSKEKLNELIHDANLTAGSWEDQLLDKCYYESFSIPPKRGDAILFYSQHPSGRLDKASTHGACPVLKGQKWAANVWVWNACRWSLCKKDALKPAAELPKALKAQNTRLNVDPQGGIIAAHPN